ncbi:hypothetical protein GCM10029976_092740 [Kribbella albertanoniae]
MSAITTALMERFMNRDVPRPSRRRPRRDDVVTYQVRVELEETEPLLWRRLELASDLFLNEVHDIIQVAFGWTDSHLHEFASGAAYYDQTSEHYLCPFQVEEGETGVPENEVRLDEVLVEQGDELLYLYDFGDDWMHVIKLESVQPRVESAPRAHCVDGRRPGPCEDCGGVDGYEQICTAIDPSDPGSAAAIADWVSRFGAGADPSQYAPTPFDLEAINEMLAVAGTKQPALAGPLEGLVNAIRSTPERRKFQQLIARAGLDQPIDIDAATAAEMVAPYSWLLNRVGTDGIKLTSAGYLRPADVEAAMAELGLGDEWIGKGNREVQTLPVLTLRETAQMLGLVRKYKGALVLTPRGRAVRQDPLALWWHVAEHLPPTKREPYNTQAGLIVLVALAARSYADSHSTVASLLTALGWGFNDGRPISSTMASEAAWDTQAVLRRIGAVARERRFSVPDLPTPEGVTFARAALRTWPS